MCKAVWGIALLECDWIGTGQESAVLRHRLPGARAAGLFRRTKAGTVGGRCNLPRRASEAVWQAYAKVIGAQLPLSFRDKCTGWQQYSVQLNGTAHPYRQDPYMRLFLSDVILRPSCYHCPAKVQAVCRI